LPGDSITVLAGGTATTAGVPASHRPRLDCDLRSAKQVIIETGIGDYIGRLMTDGTSVFV
jgi:hypothetical protein